MANYVEQYRASLEKVLYQPGKINDLLTQVEAKTGVKRLYIALGVLGLLSIYLVFGYGAQLVCNAIGFVYPAYASLKALESSHKDDDTKWLTYWVVYAYLSTIEFFSDILLSWFPFYWLAKCVLLLWCFAPGTWNGSNILYNKVIRPAYLKYQSRVDTVLQDANSHAMNLAAKAADKVQQAVLENLSKKD